MVRSLPLRTGYFRVPTLSNGETQELLEWARSLVPQLASVRSEWTYLCEKKGVQICEDRQRGGPFYSIRGITTIKASLTDVMDVMASGTTSEYRSTCRSLFNDHFLDSAVVYHKNVSEMESLSIKWLALKSHSTMTNDTDFSVLEYAGIVSGNAIGEDPEKKIGVCLYESIEQEECPVLLDSHKLDRGSVSRCGYVFRPTNEAGILEASFVCSIRQPPGMRSRRRANRTILAYWGEVVGRIQESINSTRISRMISAREKTAWVSDAERHCCHLCLKMFTNVRRKHHCRACGEVICGKCSSYNDVELPSIGTTSLRLCKYCVEGDLDAEADAPPSSVFSTAKQANEYQLAIPSQGKAVPDQVGVAWLKQLAARNPENRKMVENFLENIDSTTDKEFGFNNVAAEAPPEDIYDLLCDLASQALGCKFAVVSLVDENRQWFKSKINISESEIPRDFSFCNYPVQLKKPIVVMDTLYDDRFDTNPFVTGPLAVRFLAGAPLFSLDGDCVGSVSVLDTEPRESLPRSQLALMEKLAHLAMVSMQERREVVASKLEEEESIYGNTPIRALPFDAIQPNRPIGTQLVAQPAPAPVEQHSHTSAANAKEEYQLRMMRLLQQSHRTRQQVQENQQTWMQSAGLGTSDSM